ncbi:MAG TPA: hypothetical protein VGL68_06335 [Solirubrobacteraceae bacterium]
MDERRTPFELTIKERTSTNIMLGLALCIALGLTTVFAAFRSGNGSSIWLWLLVGLAALLIAAWSGYVSYPASRVLRLRRLERRLARSARRVSKAFDALELIVRGMAASAERMRRRLIDVDHRASITFVRSYRRHHADETLPPTVPDPGFISENQLLEHLLRPLGDLDIHAALGTDPRANDGVLGDRPAGHSPPRHLPTGATRLVKSTTGTATTTRLRE